MYTLTVFCHFIPRSNTLPQHTVHGDDEQQISTSLLQTILWPACFQAFYASLLNMRNNFICFTLSLDFHMHFSKLTQLQCFCLSLFDFVVLKYLRL